MSKLSQINIPVVTGDCLEVMQGLDSGLFTLIATDPPFNTGKDWVQYQDQWSWTTARDNERMSLKPYEQTVLDAIGMAHGVPMKAYCTFMWARLAEMKRLLSEDGSIYIHCDKTSNSYIRMVMDCIFGKENFRNEIIWCYRGMGAGRKRFQQKHDTILYYVKDKKKFYFNPLRTAPTEGSLRSYRTGMNVGYIANKSRNMAVVFDQNKYEKAVEEGRLPEGMKTTPFTTGQPIMRDWWDDVRILSHGNKERTGYATQKPLELYRRIIEASACPAGGYILDPFCGSGTTLLAARSIGRSCFGIDINPEAKDIIRKRMEGQSWLTPGW